MAKFESSLSNKSFPSQPMKEYDVPDESDPGMTPVMRRRGQAPHGAQAPVDINAAMAYQQQMQASYSQEDPAELEKQIKEARELKRVGRESLNEGAKKRIEMLVGMTRSTRQIDLEDKVYVLRTLRSKEMREAVMAASEYDHTVQSPFEIRRQLIARSLVQIAGLDIEQFVGSKDLSAKLQLVDDLDEPLLNRLYDEYLALIREAKERYVIKDEEDAKNLVEDLKK